MKHFIGGAALGTVIAIIGIPRGSGKSDMDYLAGFIAHSFVAVLFGAMAWGLLP